MQPRINYDQINPEAFKAVLALENYVSKESGLEPRLIHLIKLRASQINGCAYCVDMHVKEARHSGLSEQWINLVCAWRESPIYDPRERALLAWTEALTNLPSSSASDTDFEKLKEYFSDDEISKLTVAIGTINIWNRIAVGFRYQHPIDENDKNN